MKTLTFGVLAILAATAFAKPTPAQIAKMREAEKNMTPEQRAERAKRFKAAIYRHTGGTIVKPGSQNGRIVYVNCQKAAPSDWIFESVTNFVKMTKFNIAMEEGAFAFPNPKIVGELSLFIVDDEKLPPILSAPESRWAMVNVSGLKKGAGAKQPFFHARVEKELTRGFCLLAGTQTSNYPNSLVGSIVKPEDLDQHVDWRLPVDVIARFRPYVSAYGVTPAEEFTYKKACREGWAPQPTNDVQKAIWDQVTATPKTPMKIEFDPKKGR